MFQNIFTKTIDEKDENVYNTNIQQESDKLFMRTFHIKEPNSLEKIVKRFKLIFIQILLV